MMLKRYVAFQLFAFNHKIMLQRSNVAKFLKLGTNAMLFILRMQNTPARVLTHIIHCLMIYYYFTA